MDSGDDIRVPQVATATRLIHVPSLREACINTLIRYHQYLGDVGFLDAESLRSVAWYCNTEELKHIEDETLSGSGRNLEWYTWHLWRRLLSADLGTAGQQKVPPLQSPQPVDYTPPKGIDAKPGDYRKLYMQRKVEMQQRAAAAKERIAAAYQQAQELKESRKAKMIDKLVPAKRQRCSIGSQRGIGSQPQSPVSAFMHKPRADSRSSLMAKPGAQLKLLKDLGLVKPPTTAKPESAVRVVRPSPVPSAATGRCSSLAGAKLLNKATGGQLGRTSVGVESCSRGAGLHVDAKPPLVAAREAAVAAAAAERSGRTQPSAPTALAGSKRSAPAASSNQSHSNHVTAFEGGSGPCSGSRGSSGQGGPARPDPRVMFPRQRPPQSTPGQSKFAVPTARPLIPMAPAGSRSPVPAGRTAGGMKPVDDL